MGESGLADFGCSSASDCWRAVTKRIKGDSTLSLGKDTIKQFCEPVALSRQLTRKFSSRPLRRE